MSVVKEERPILEDSICEFSTDGEDNHFEDPVGSAGSPENENTALDPHDNDHNSDTGDGDSKIQQRLWTEAAKTVAYKMDLEWDLAGSEQQPSTSSGPDSPPPTTPRKKKRSRRVKKRRKLSKKSESVVVVDVPNPSPPPSPPGNDDGSSEPAEAKPKPQRRPRGRPAGMAPTQGLLNNKTIYNQHTGRYECVDCDKDFAGFQYKF